MTNFDTSDGAYYLSCASLARRVRCTVFRNIVHKERKELSNTDSPILVT